jgi:hypothetical protein
MRTFSRLVEEYSRSWSSWICLQILFSSDTSFREVAKGPEVSASRIAKPGLFKPITFRNASSLRKSVDRDLEDRNILSRPEMKCAYMGPMRAPIGRPEDLLLYA